MECLVLDVSYRPVGVIPDTRGFVLAHYRQCAQVVHEEPRAGLTVPKVIRLNRSVPYRQALKVSGRAIFQRDNWTCQYCQCSLSKGTATIDHVLPKSRGGDFSFRNLVAACHSCNQKKKNRTPEEAGMILERMPFTPPSTAKIHKFHESWLNYLWE